MLTFDTPKNEESVTRAVGLCAVLKVLFEFD